MRVRPRRDVHGSAVVPPTRQAGHNTPVSIDLQPPRDPVPEPAVHFAPATFPWLDDGPPPRLDAGAVHVWHVALDASRPIDDTVLDAGERARAERFVHAADRARWVGARVALRAILARYSGVAPAALAFAHEPLGRPRLAGPHAALGFNLSHGRCCALVAVAVGGVVGVDVECRGPGPDALAIARDVFDEAEARVLAALPDTATRDMAFRRAWCCKEAWLKAHGVGLTVPLATVPVRDDGDGGCVLADHDATRSVGRWTGALLSTPGTACTGALVVAGAGRRITGARWRT